MIKSKAYHYVSKPLQYTVFSMGVKIKNCEIFFNFFKALIVGTS